MRVPLSWLRACVDVPISIETLAERLTLAGIEVETIERLGVFDPEVVVGELVSVARIDERRAAWRVEVDCGERLTLVTGAPNVSSLTKGTRLAVARAGARIFDPEAEFSVRTVTPATLYGVESRAVLCSERELGVGPDHTGLLVLAADSAAGAKLRDVLEPQPSWTADEVLVLAILPNIARCQSLLGVAREVSALTNGQSVAAPSLADIVVARGELDPKIEVPELCRRFSVARVSGIRIQPSPAWLRRRLALSGVDPINNVVDVLNYVMLELGQPMHAYDARRLPAQRLGVRLSRAGERIRTLAQAAEDEPFTLPASVLLVTSDDVPVAVAGVIGGRDASIHDDTTTVLLESANFDFISIRKAQGTVKIHTEASARFSRGVDPALTDVGIRRVLALLRELDVAWQLEATGETSSLGELERHIAFSVDDLNRSLGMQLEEREVVELLGRVGIRTERTNGALSATVPSSRTDIELPCDLMEEVARLHGYDKMPETIPDEAIPMAPRNRARELRESARDAMVLWGLEEAISYTLTSPALERLLWSGSSSPPPEPPYVRLQNPMSARYSVVRRTLLPGLLEALRENRRYSDVIRTFELGIVALPELPSDHPLLPREVTRLAIAMTGPRDPASFATPDRGRSDFFEIADAVRFLFRHLHVPNLEFEQAEQTPFHPGICARVVGAGKTFGYCGALHPSVQRAFDLREEPVFCAELELDAILPEAVHYFPAREPMRLPSIDVDIAILVDQRYPAQALVDAVRRAGGEWVHDAFVFDHYVGPQVPEGQRSVGIRISLNAGTRTLTMDEARATREKMTRALATEFAAVARE